MCFETDGPAGEFRGINHRKTAPVTISADLFRRIAGMLKVAEYKLSLIEGTEQDRMAIESLLQSMYEAKQ
ncbi:MAG: hypothetical protein ABIT70_01610 [Sulfuriferula sp.]